MKLWITIVMATMVSAAAALLLSILFCWRRRRSPLSGIAGSKLFSGDRSSSSSRRDKVESGLSKFQQYSSQKQLSKKSRRFHHLRQQRSKTSSAAFDWADHPKLIAEAVENGWLRFTFDGHGLSNPYRSITGSSSRWWPGLCVPCDSGRHGGEIEIDWEIPLGSSEFMQTVRLNPGVKNAASVKAVTPLIAAAGEDSSSPSCSTRMCLPLPGPPLGNLSFPQEAYFEITILHLQTPYRHRAAILGKKLKSWGSISKEDRAKLVGTNSFHLAGPGSSQSSGDVASPAVAMEDANLASSKLVVSLGLTVGGPIPAGSTPGTYEGSIGFHSNGSVFLDGKKLVFESEKTDWGGVNRVIGCGFDPTKKKVVLTVDGELVHIIKCKSDDYQNPLFPAISSAAADVTVVVNLGQSAFTYLPANANRVTNPCFLRPSPENGSIATMGYDSRELFSVDRIDDDDGSDWRDRSFASKSRDDDDDESRDAPAKIRSYNSSVKSTTAATADFDADPDLFEIVLSQC